MLNYAHNATICRFDKPVWHPDKLLNYKKTGQTLHPKSKQPDIPFIKKKLQRTQSNGKFWHGVCIDKIDESA